MSRSTIRFAWALAGLLVAAAPSAAQAPPQTLSLTHAMDLARRNNPGFLAVENDRAVAEWDVRQAYAAWIPRASLGGNLGWQGQGEQVLAGALTASQFGLTGQPDYYSSSYSAGLSLSVSGQTIYGPRLAKSAQRSTEANVAQERILLETQVTRLYLDVLRQNDAVELAEAQLDRSTFNLELAQAQASVGTATLLDVRQAEVQVGRSEVGLLQASNNADVARIDFLALLGLDPTAPVELITEFLLEEPLYDEMALVAEALQGPLLGVNREAVESGRVQERIALSAYFPTISLSAGVSGFAREASDPAFLIAQGQARVAGQVASCQSTNDLYSRLANPLPPLDCGQFVFTDADRQAIIDQNNAFPFDFTRSPPSAGLNISIPVFQGLSRQRNLEAARVQSEDARLRLRDQEIGLRASVAREVSRVRTAYASAVLEQRNQALADEQLALAQERYQLGGVPFLDLVEAETVKAQADRDLVAAIYAYHDAVTFLEAAIGRPLRDR